MIFFRPENKTALNSKWVRGDCTVDVILEPISVKKREVCTREALRGGGMGRDLQPQSSLHSAIFFPPQNPQRSIFHVDLCYQGVCWAPFP